MSTTVSVTDRATSTRRMTVLALTVALAVVLTLLPATGAAQELDAPPSESSDIVAGTPIPQGTYPFLVNLRIVKGSGTFLCGGSLLSADWVVTAAHCLDGAVAGGVTVNLGSVDRAAPVQSITAAQLVQHPDWAVTEVSDIALIRLSQPANLAHPRIGTIVWNQDAATPAVGSMVTVMGWGVTDGFPDDNSGSVQFARQTSVRVVACNGPLGAFQASHICVFGPDAQPTNPNNELPSACFGDSGGPLVREIHGVWTLLGTVEGGAEGSCGQLPPYGTYQRLSWHHQWIVNTTGIVPPLLCAGKPVTIDMNTGAPGLGTPGDDVILGTPGSDTIDALAGNDTVCAGGGSDTVFGRDGNDVLYGEAGNDRMWAHDGNDMLDGGPGNDLLKGGNDNDEILGQDGDDNMTGDRGNDVIRGGPGRDRGWGFDGNDSMYGDAGVDTLQGMRGNDRLFGGPDNDVLLGQNDDDRLDGGPGNDALAGGNGNDELDGGEGHDRTWGQNGSDEARGGPGNDLVNGGGAGPNWLYGEEGNDRMVGGTGVDRAWGGPGNDRIWLGSGNDLGWGQADDDRIFGQNGTDTCDGGPGTDITATCETNLNIP